MGLQGGFVIGPEPLPLQLGQLLIQAAQPLLAPAQLVLKLTPLLVSTGLKLLQLGLQLLDDLGQLLPLLRQLSHLLIELLGWRRRHYGITGAARHGPDRDEIGQFLLHALDPLLQGLDVRPHDRRRRRDRLRLPGDGLRRRHGGRQRRRTIRQKDGGEYRQAVAPLVPDAPLSGGMKSVFHGLLL
jgi:hypothetical protein